MLIGRRASQSREARTEVDSMVERDVAYRKYVRPVPAVKTVRADGVEDILAEIKVVSPV